MADAIRTGVRMQAARCAPDSRRRRGRTSAALTRISAEGSVRDRSTGTGRIIAHQREDADGLVEGRGSAEVAPHQHQLLDRERLSLDEGLREVVGESQRRVAPRDREMCAERAPFRRELASERVLDAVGDRCEPSVGILEPCPQHPSAPGRREGAEPPDSALDPCRDARDLGESVPQPGHEPRRGPPEEPERHVPVLTRHPSCRRERRTPGFDRGLDRVRDRRGHGDGDEQSMLCRLRPRRAIPPHGSDDAVALGQRLGLEVAPHHVEGSLLSPAAHPRPVARRDIAAGV